MVQQGLQECVTSDDSSTLAWQGLQGNACGWIVMGWVACDAGSGQWHSSSVDCLALPSNAKCWCAGVGLNCICFMVQMHGPNAWRVE
jgi:hypothetical protein